MASGSWRPHASLNRNSISRIASSSALVILPLTFASCAPSPLCQSPAHVYPPQVGSIRLAVSSPAMTAWSDRPRGADEDSFRRGPPLAAVGPWFVGTGPAVGGDRGTVSLGSHRRRLLGDLTANIDRLGDEGGDEGQADDACHNLELGHLSRSPMLG